MASAPTRPPGHQSERREPKGPRVALTPKDQQRRDQLVTAAKTLRKAGKPDLADAVDFVLTLDGARFVSRLRAEESDADRDPNLPIKMRTSYRDAIRAGQGNLTGVLNRGFERFVAGEFEVLDERAPRGTSATDPMVVLNTRPDGQLQGRVATRCRELSETGVGSFTLTGVAKAILFEHFQIGPYAPDKGSE